MTDEVLDLVCQRFTGRPAADLDWRDLVTVRDAVARLINDEINRRQAPARPGIEATS